MLCTREFAVPGGRDVSGSLRLPQEGAPLDLPVNKNRSWIAQLHKSIGRLDSEQQAQIMKSCGQGCASDLLSICEDLLGRKVGSPEDLIAGWNMLREQRGLTGGWKSESNAVRGIFRKCGCPLVRSGLIELHPVQCLCSQGMMETIFSTVARRPVQVELLQTIGRGDEVCEFLVKLQER